MKTGILSTKEHELVDELKFEFQSAEAARREAQMMTCPKCSGKFAEVPVYGI